MKKGVLIVSPLNRSKPKFVSTCHAYGPCTKRSTSSKSNNGSLSKDKKKKTERQWKRVMLHPNPTCKASPSTLIWNRELKEANWWLSLSHFICRMLSPSKLTHQINPAPLKSHYSPHPHQHFLLISNNYLITVKTPNSYKNIK